MQKSNSKNVLGIFFLLSSLIYTLFVCMNNRGLFITKYDAQGTRKLYEQSQWQQSQNISADKVLDEWAIKRKYTGWENFVDGNKDTMDTEKIKREILVTIQEKGISDSTLYSYVGYEYVHGASPSLLNPEHPPLGKYLIGTFILLFGNAYIGLLILCVALLFIVYKITHLITHSFVSSSFAVFLTCIFPLFFDQLIHGPQLELFQLYFSLLLFYSLLLWEKSHKTFYLLFAGLWYGCALSTKTFIPFFVMFSGVLCVYFWISSGKRLSKTLSNFCIVTCIGIFIFVTTYFSFFFQGGTIHSFLALQKYIFTFYQNAHISLLEFAGNYIRLIVTGSWKFWDTSRTVSFYSEWNILWPLVFIVGTFSMLKNKNKIFTVFSVIYNLFLFFTPIFPRYLLLLFVPYIISICQFTTRIWKK